MIGSVPANRRAHAFAQALDESGLDGEAAGAQPDAGREAPADGAEQAALLSVADRLASLPRPALGAATKAVQREQLIAAMESAAAESAAGAGAEAAAAGESAGAVGVPGQRRSGRSGGTHRVSPLGALDRLRPKSRLSKGLAAGGLTMGVAAGAFGGVAVASTNALPGDTLYGLKRGMEDLRLDLAQDDADRGEVYLDHASTRLSEARRLMEEDRLGTLDHEQLSEVRRALTSMRDNVAEGHRLLSEAYETEGSIDPIRSLSAFSDGHRGRWSELRELLPLQLSDVSNDVTSVFDAMEEEVTPLRPLLPEIPETTTSSDAGAGHGERGVPSGSPAAGQEPSAAPATSGSGGSGPRSAPEGEERSGTADEDAPEETGGLLDGPGLLDAVPESGSKESSGTDGTAASDAENPQPELTVPPLVNDLLPGLGLELEDGAGDTGGKASGSGSASGTPE